MRLTTHAFFPSFLAGFSSLGAFSLTFFGAFFASTGASSLAGFFAFLAGTFSAFADAVSFLAAVFFTGAFFGVGASSFTTVCSVFLTGSSVTSSGSAGAGGLPPLMTAVISAFTLVKCSEFFLEQHLLRCTLKICFGNLRNQYLSFWHIWLYARPSCVL